MPFSLSLEQRQSLIWLTLWVAAFALLLSLGPVLTPFLAAAILAYALNPGVDRLAAIKIGKFALSRTLAVTIVMILFCASLLALVLIVAPVLQKEGAQLRDQIPLFSAKISDWVIPRLRELGMPIPKSGADIKDFVARHLASSGEEIASTVLASVKVGGGAVLSWLATMLLVPVVLFYLLLDWHKAVAKVLGAIPRRFVARTEEMLNEVDDLLAQYLRGQLLVMLALAIYYSLGLALAGFEVALPVGVITGLLVFIPYLGYGLGLLLALIAAVLQFPGPQGLIAVAVVYGLGQILESFVLTPRLVGERIGMNPLAVIFALLAFGQLFGFVGVLLALPASAVLMVAFKHLRNAYLQSSFYLS
ncbi:AI-2E family transporter [Massilia sp. W12]|uniref:AI-2E family transporter n=1 Tax=Massilia sp. W12 TaxID=3126507 RepID=UPI0030D00070